MANRRFEMYEVRQIIQRLRLGESDRQIARSQRVGRVKVAWLREDDNKLAARMSEILVSGVSTRNYARVLPAMAASTGIARSSVSRAVKAASEASRKQLMEREDNKALAARLREAHNVCDEHRDIATASLIELWIDETERRTWFLFEASRKGDATGH